MRVTIYLLSLVGLLGDATVSGVHMGLEQLVLSKGSCTYCTLVRQVGRFQRLVVILGNVVQQLPLVHLLGKVHKIVFNERMDWISGLFYNGYPVSFIGIRHIAEP